MAATELDASSTSDITLTDVTASGSTGGAGAVLDNCIINSGSCTSGNNSSSISGAPGQVIIDPSTFNNNWLDGLDVTSNGFINLIDVTADNNGQSGTSGSGAVLDNSASTNPYAVELDYSTGNQFNSNHNDGLDIKSASNINISQVTVDSNGGNGTYLNNSFSSTPYAMSVDVIGGGVSEFNGNTSDGLKVNSNGDATLANITANSNLSYGAYISNGGSLIVDPSTFNSNGQDGLNVSSIGSILLTDVTADDNTSNGAYLDNSGGGLGNISIDSSIFNDNKNTGRGLIAHSNHDISLNDVTASGNGGGGAELDNTFGTGSILLTGTNTFNDNGLNLTPSVGLYAVSEYDVNLNGVTAIGNGYGIGGGAFVATDFGDLSITNGMFNSNCTYCEFGFGFVAFSGGDTTLLDVTADSNGNDPSNGYTGSAQAIGGLIFDDGSVSIQNSNFSGNCTLGDCSGRGIEILDLGAGDLVSFDHVTANGNGIASGSGGGGALISGDDNIDINCSTFNNNAGVGLEADTSSGNTITLNGVTLDGNTGGATDIPSGTLFSSAGNCGSKSKGTTPILGGPIIPVTGGPLNIINVADGSGQGYALDCTQYSGTELVLPNGDHVLMPCPIGNNAALMHVANNKLPGALDSKFTFISAMDSQVTPSPLSGTAMVSFTIPSGKQGANLAILHWDGTKWVNLGGSINPPGFFSVDTNLTGDFVLVTQ